MELNSDVKEAEQQVETLKVLIADDDPPTRILLRAAITQWGYQVVEASDGEEAWDLLQLPDAPRLVILDWIMPKLDGIDLCMRIKKELAHRPYIILLTRVEGTANIIKGLEAGADEFLSKPFNMAELRSRLSVGAKIVKYEITLAEKNKQLKNYISCIQELSNLTLEISQKLMELLKAEQSEASPQVASQVQKIQDLHENLKHIIEVIQNFNLHAGK